MVLFQKMNSDGNGLVQRRDVEIVLGQISPDPKGGLDQIQKRMIGREDLAYGLSNGILRSGVDQASG
jgi:hypothetical protein